MKRSVGMNNRNIPVRRTLTILFVFAIATLACAPMATAANVPSSQSCSLLPPYR